MLERVRYRDLARGIDVHAFTDGYAYDDYGRVHLLSVAGRDSNVKAVTTALVSGFEVEVISGEWLALRKDYAEQYRVLSARLPSGLVHQLVLSHGFFERDGLPRRLVYAEDEDGIARLVYETVRGSYAVPLIPEWSDWLCERMRREDMLRQLSGTRTVVEISADEERLDELISAGVMNGEIRF